MSIGRHSVGPVLSVLLYIIIMLGCGYYIATGGNYHRREPDE